MSIQNQFAFGLHPDLLIVHLFMQVFFEFQLFYGNNVGFFALRG